MGKGIATMQGRWFRKYGKEPYTVKHWEVWEDNPTTSGVITRLPNDWKIGDRVEVSMIGESFLVVFRVTGCYGGTGPVMHIESRY